MGSGVSKQQKRRTELLLQWREVAAGGGQSAVDEWLLALDRTDYLSMITAQKASDVYVLRVPDSASGTHYHILVEAQWKGRVIEVIFKHLQLYDSNTVPHRFRNLDHGDKFRSYDPIIMWDGNVGARMMYPGICCTMCTEIFHRVASMFAADNLRTIPADTAPYYGAEK